MSCIKSKFSYFIQLNNKDFIAFSGYKNCFFNMSVADYQTKVHCTSVSKQCCKFYNFVILEPGDILEFQSA